jgi:predicted AlkP superfamily pyrophosphatase or phosphodiesterase
MGDAAKKFETAENKSHSESQPLMIRLLAHFLLILLSCLTALADPLVFVSIDGLRADFYQNDEYAAPTLKRLAREGASATAVYPVFPSFTYPNHATLATGCRPARHGIHTNAIEDGPAWFWEQSSFLVPTIWDVATKAGLRVGLLSWPTTVDADVEFLIPEIFHVPGANTLSTLELLIQHSTPGLFERFDITVGNTFREWDEETRRVAVGLLQSREVDLLMIHLIQVDKAQHEYGPEHEEVRKAVSLVDNILEDIVEAAGPNSTFVVVGDHGFRAYHKIYRPKAVIQEAGLEARARVKATAGSAAIYTDDTKVLDLFSTNEDAIERILTQQELQEMGAFPGAVACLVAAPGYIFSGHPTGPSKTDRIKGQHGYLPEDVPTGWIIHGPGILPGTSLGQVEIIHVAPTVAQLLGLKLPEAEGENILK